MQFVTLSALALIFLEWISQKHSFSSCKDLGEPPGFYQSNIFLPLASVPESATNRAPPSFSGDVQRCTRTLYTDKNSWNGN